MSLIEFSTSNHNLIEIVKAMAPVITAAIAFWGLRNWQRQDKSKREVEFLDGLIEAAHAYIADISKPMTVLEYARIAMRAHERAWEGGDGAGTAIKGAIAFIQKDGERVGRHLFQELKVVQPSTIKLKSLIVKGQMLNFKEYDKCQRAINMMTWQFGRMEAFAAMIASNTWNWENAEVTARWKDVMNIDPDVVRRSVQENNVALIQFASATYRRIYSPTLVLWPLSRR